MSGGTYRDEGRDPLVPRWATAVDPSQRRDENGSFIDGHIEVQPLPSATGEAKREERAPEFKPGYHLRPIKKGVLGEISKIREELEELEDADAQGVIIMTLVELADLYGAIKAYARVRGVTMDDLAKMSEVTERAFISGQRR